MGGASLWNYSFIMSSLGDVISWEPSPVHGRSSWQRGAASATAPGDEGEVPAVMWRDTGAQGTAGLVHSQPWRAIPTPLWTGDYIIKLFFNVTTHTRFGGSYRRPFTKYAYIRLYLQMHILSMRRDGEGERGRGGERERERKHIIIQLVNSFIHVHNMIFLHYRFKNVMRPLPSCSQRTKSSSHTTRLPVGGQRRQRKLVRHFSLSMNTSWRSWGLTRKPWHPWRRR